MPKRNATSELNHDNWNVDDVPEEAGTFQKATTDVIEKRVIRSARRRVVGSSGTGSNVFAGFQGFNKNTDNSSNPSLFGFLKNSSTSQENTGQDKSGGEEIKLVSTGSSSMFKPPMKEISYNKEDPCLPSPPYTLSYLGAIKKLNECFVKHIQTCYNENQLIIFNPCFRDYEKYLKGILPLNDSAGKVEGENSVSEEKEETVLSHKSSSEDKPLLSADSGKKSSIFGNVNTEVSAASGFKMFGESNTLQRSSPVATGTASLFGGPATKQFPWMGGWGSSGSPSPVSSSVPAKDSSKTEAKASEESVDENDTPPKAEFKQVVEEGAVYSRRCKVFVKKENSFHDHGVGMLYLKPVETGKKTQLIVRADTSLGNLILNTLLSADMSIQKMGNNNVMLVCLPTPDFKPPKPLPVLLRVKTTDDADELLQKLNEYKK